MKNGVLIILLLSGIMSIQGQQKMDPVKMAKYQTQLMIDRLDLVDGQEKELRGINEKYSELQAALLNKEGSMFSKIGDMKRIKKEKNQELERVLTKEQMKVYEKELEPEMRETMKKQMNQYEART